MTTNDVTINITQDENGLLSRAKNNTKVQEVNLLKKVDRYAFFKNIQSASDARIVVDGSEKINLGSNNYLGLTTNPAVIEASNKATRDWGTGVTGSRVLNGTLSLHQTLEEELALFYNAESALVFSTGYSANLGIISSLLKYSDKVIVDTEAHASILDGVYLSKASYNLFEHNNCKHLRTVIEGMNNPSLCIIEGIYSMRGDVAPIREIHEICKDKNILLMVDEAHGLGVMGKTGAGASEAAGMLNDIDLFTVTFSKSLASCGGAVIGNRHLIEMIKLNSRPFLFTASNTPGSMAATIESLRILKNNPEMIEELAERTSYFKSSLTEYGIPFLSSESAIIAVPIGSDFRVLQAWKVLFNKNIFCNPVLPPGVPKGKGLLRFSIMRTHKKEDLDYVAKACKEILFLIDYNSNR
jgi:8-amino-7-oxononanoate synthase